MLSVSPLGTRRVSKLFRSDGYRLYHVLNTRSSTFCRWAVGRQEASAVPFRVGTDGVPCHHPVQSFQRYSILGDACQDGALECHIDAGLV